MPEIIFNREYLESMNGSFETVFDKVDTASQFAFLADNSSCMRNLAVKESDDVRSIIRLIIDSFSSTDQKMKEKAQSIIGVDIHNGISSGGYAIIYEDGEYVVQSKYDIYQQETTSQILNDYRGVLQPNKYDCTSCASTTMLQRWLVMNGRADKAAGLSYRDVKSQMGGKWHITPGNPISYDGVSFILKGVGNCDNNGANDFLKQKSPSGNSQEGLANLLMEHPEGIVFYSHYSNGRNSEGWSDPHAITITRFTQDENGSYQFYAQDPNLGSSGGKEVRLEDTWLFKNNTSYYQNSIDVMLNRGISIQYIESVQ